MVLVLLTACSGYTEEGRVDRVYGRFILVLEPEGVVYLCGSGIGGRNANCNDAKLSVEARSDQQKSTRWFPNVDQVWGFDDTETPENRTSRFT